MKKIITAGLVALALIASQAVSAVAGAEVAATGKASLASKAFYHALDQVGAALRLVGSGGAVRR